jgi:putative endonuclease
MAICNARSPAPASDAGPSMHARPRIVRIGFVRQRTMRRGVRRATTARFRRERPPSGSATLRSQGELAGMRDYYVYIAASLSRCLYVGVTNDLRRRMAEHAAGTLPGHTRCYRISRLVYFEQTTNVVAAIAREKQLKRWPRWRKIRLIEERNRDWRDLRTDWRT